jgi:hypothetical protein
MGQNEKPGLDARLLQRRREETLLAALALVLDSVELAAFFGSKPPPITDPQYIQTRQTLLDVSNTLLRRQTYVKPTALS